MSFDLALHVFQSPQFQGLIDDAVVFFASTPPHPLPPPMRFVGTGVYALYYTGEFELYARLAIQNRTACTQPIYVGKAVPSGWRRARIRDSDSAALHQRLQEHARSIRQASTLQLEDFRCKFTILSGVESDLVVPVEAELIRRCRPLWNSGVDGFGNHDPGSGRYNQARSDWDVLHPGRPWTERLTGKSPLQEDVEDRVRQFLEGSDSP